MATVYNMNVAGIVRRLRRYRYEIVKSASSNQHAVSNPDADRFRSYFQAMKGYLDYVQNVSPGLDLPESSPLEIDLGEAETLEVPDNDALIDMVYYFDRLESELINSQSSRMPIKLISHDERRVRELIGAMETLLEQYIAQVLPLDLPESSPLRPMTGSGRTGVAGGPKT